MLRPTIRSRSWLYVPLAVLMALVSAVLISAASASPTVTTTTLLTNEISLANSYARSLLQQAPVPHQVASVAKLPAPLSNVTGTFGLVGGARLHHFYVVKGHLDLNAFLRSHLSRGAVLDSTTTSDSNTLSTVGYHVTPACTDCHFSYCEVDYTLGTSSNGVQELRIDVAVLWLPV